MENANVVLFKELDSQKSDFFLCFCGYSRCEPLHSFGPAVRPNYLLHVVLSGQGSYHVDGKSYTLREGQGFLIEPNVQTFYQADADDPWYYLWVGFSGRLCREYLNELGLLSGTPVFTTRQGPGLLELVKQMHENSRVGVLHKYRLNALLYEFFALLAEETVHEGAALPRPGGNYYVREAVEYIKANYSTAITVGDIASYVNLSRSYLFTLFQRETGMSPKEYLQRFRLTRAAELLTLSELSVESIATSCGYGSPLVFSKAFKQLTGSTPREYRKSHPQHTGVPFE